MKKVAQALKLVYGYGILVALFLGGATVLGYIIAMILGGEIAVIICEFIYKKLFLCLILGADVVVLIGLLSMYISNEKAMIFNTGNKKQENNNNKDKTIDLI